MNAARAPLALALLLAACSRKDPEPTPAPRPAPAPEPVASAAAPSAKRGEVGWDAPTGWTKAETTSPMRKATYKVGADAELAVSEAGGDAAANVKRWEGQFGGAAATTEERHPNGLDVTVVTIAGTYAGMGDPAPKKDHALLGAIVKPATPGDPATFFKLVGPKGSVDAARADFDKLVASLHR